MTGQSLLSAMLDTGGAGGVKCYNIIMELIFLQLDKLDVVMMSSRLSSASSQPGYKNVVMMLDCPVMTVLQL